MRFTTNFTFSARRTRSMSSIMSAALVGVSLAMTLLVSGCASGGDGSRGSGGRGSLEQALSEYNAGRFAVAQERAEQAITGASAEQRAEAAYIAGLSAYQLQQFDAAERHLRAAAGSRDQATAGKANAMLGMMRFRQSRPNEAGDLLRTAARQLDGLDAQESARRAADAYERAGNQTAAREMRMFASEPSVVMASTASAVSARPGAPPTASTSASSSPPTTTTTTAANNATASRTTSAGGFALQVGAFEERWRAERAARDVLPFAQRQNLEPVRIGESRDGRGKTLHIVQFGRFLTKEEASRARQRLGKLEYIPAAMVPGDLVMR